jgi:hypothetical protein
VALEVRLIVTDAPPLITLAVAKSLDYLLYAEVPVVIPDAVFHEATGAAGKLGAQRILDRYRAHMDDVRVEPSEIFQDGTTLREVAGRRPSRDLGERAALEVIRNLPMSPDERALLLSDDRDAERWVIVDPGKLILLTTWDYLRQLEDAQRIQSADAIFAVVSAAGRNPPTRDLWSRHDPEVRDAVRAIITRARGPRTCRAKHGSEVDNLFVSRMHLVKQRVPPKETESLKAHERCSTTIWFGL